MSMTPVPEGLVGFEERHEFVPARAVDEDLYWAELVDYLDVSRRDRVGTCDVHGDGNGDPTAGVDGLSGGKRAGEIDVGDRDSATVAGERHADFAPDPAPASGDKRDPSAHAAATAPATSAHLARWCSSRKISSRPMYMMSLDAAPLYLETSAFGSSSHVAMTA